MVNNVRHSYLYLQVRMSDIIHSVTAQLQPPTLCGTIKHMKKYFLDLSMMAIMFSGALGVSAEGETVYIATIDSEITAGTVQYVTRSLESATKNEADVFILELNTPGGLLKATEDISRSLVEATIPTVVYVYKDTGFALSAGVYILLSADISAAQPTAVIGAATPITGSGDDATQKIINASAEWLGVLAARNNRTVEEIKEFVFAASTMSGVQASEEGIVDLLASSTNALLTELGYEDATVTRVSPTWVDNLLSFLSLPFLVPLLLSLGGIGLFFMFRTGDIESIGILGVVFLLLGLWGTGAITISTLGLLLMVTGLTLLAVEFLLSPGFGIVGLAGIVALVISTVTFANEPLFPSYFASTVFYSVMGVWLALAVLMIWIGRLSVATFFQPIQVGSEVWYGKVLTLENDLTPDGRVSLEGDSYIARSIDGNPITAGTLVSIVKIEGNTIMVTLADKN